MDYKITPQSGNSYLHMWDVASIKTFDGGFLFDTASIPEGTERLPKGVFLKADFAEQKATLVKTAVVTKAVTTAATEVQIAKGHFLLATDVIGIGDKYVTVGTIDTSDDEYDAITIDANDLGELAKGTVLQLFDAEGEVINPDGMSPVEIEIDGQPSCSIMFRADGIVTSRLPQAPTEEIKAALRDCQFLNK